MKQTPPPPSAPVSKAVEEYEKRCAGLTTSVSNDLTIAWVGSSSIITTSGSTRVVVDLSEQLRRRLNMSIGREYRCLYCNSFVTKLETQYPRHVLTKHRGYLPYATPDDLKSAKAGRRTVGKKKGGSYNEWRHSQESIIYCIMMQAAKQKWWRQQLPIQQAHQLPMIRKALDSAGIRVRIITESNI